MPLAKASLASPRGEVDYTWNHTMDDDASCQNSHNGTRLRLVDERRSLEVEH